MARSGRGFTLVELMVAMVVGLVVVGALMSTYLAATVTTRHSQAMAQVTEDASAALGILREQLTQAGYGSANSPNAAGYFTKKATYANIGVSGCDGAFVIAAPADNISTLTCAAALPVPPPSSIAVDYEADKYTAMMSAANVPLDCLGNSLPGPNALGVYEAYNRYFLATPVGAGNSALYCKGAGGPTPQVLVENVIDMRIQYGVRALPIAPGQRAQVASYQNGAGVANWADVLTVRVCLVVASVDNVMDQATAYTGCPTAPNAAAPVIVPAATDRHLHRAFTSTVILQNRLGT